MQGAKMLAADLLGGGAGGVQHLIQWRVDKKKVCVRVVCLSDHFCQSCDSGALFGWKCMNNRRGASQWKVDMDS